MAQHFLLSAKARTLSVLEIARMSDDEAYEVFKAIRFSENGGDPHCPYCGCPACNTYKARRLFKCKDCHKQFSVTSGTTFRSRKMSYRDILAAIVLFANGVNGNAALRLSRDLGCAYKTAFALSKKLSRAMGVVQRANILTGDVDIDGLYVGGSIRQENMVEDRKSDGRKQFNAKRRSIVTMRERRVGGRSRAVVVANESAAKEAIFNTVHPSAHVTTDDGSAFNRFHRHFDEHHVVNHSVGLMVDGIHNNAVESQHSRIRRAERGVYLHISGAHIQRFADELSWRDDFRRVSNGQQVKMLLRAALRIGPDLEMAGYWQKRPPEVRDLLRRRGVRALTRRRLKRGAAPIPYTERASD